MSVEDRLRMKIEDARSQHRRATERYKDACAANDAHRADLYRFDKGYWLGLAHAYEETLDYLERNIR